MSMQTPISEVVMFFDEDEDPAPMVDGKGNYLPIVTAVGGLAGVDVEHEGEQERRVVSIVREIENVFDYKFVWKNGIPLAFSGDKEPFKPNWRPCWAFYKERFIRLKEMCNRHFHLEPNVSPMTLYLTHLFFSAKHKGRCHVIGVTLVASPKHPSRVSFGKRQHDRTMATGWKDSCPISLSDFDETGCNIVPEAWVTNLLRGNRPRAHIEKMISSLTVKGKEDSYGGDLIGSFGGLRMDDNVVPIPSRFRSISSPPSVIIQPRSAATVHDEDDPESGNYDPLLDELFSELSTLIDVGSIEPLPGDIPQLLYNTLMSPIDSEDFVNNLDAWLGAMLCEDEEDDQGMLYDA
ncbi:hypothetical protein I204_01544 [Kwoniella mangroviensis CBS 8886]|nr:hypothetical protein I204_01544 [Kwoniella mangroviensis CBS 8886]